VIRALLFDLCDTVVRTAGVGALTRHSDPAAPVSDADAEAWFRDHPLHAAYETGNATTRQFLTGLAAGLRLPLPTDTLATVYAGLVLHEIPGVAALLRRLGRHWPLWALSNNNPLLYAGTERVCTCLDVFDGILLSHHIGVLKPAPAAFAAALTAMGCEASEVVLVDDNPRCVQQARALGLAAVQFSSAADAAAQLDSLLPPPAR
jgi:putative hydrolase of the HAD superfamily